MPFNQISSIIKSIRLGEMVILVDDENRENEGDLIIASEKVTPEAINFMAMEGRGLICMSLTDERCNSLGLKQMVTHNEESQGTAFTISIDAANGVTTGISAKDRSITIQTAINQESKPSDFVKPGHVFPLKARSGGVLCRPGHTEGGCDLARLAGLHPSATMVEIMNVDGSMSRRDELILFGQKHNLKLGSIVDLIKYRAINDVLINRTNTRNIETMHGKFTMTTYKDQVTGGTHLALTKEMKPSSSPRLTRIHTTNLAQDMLALDQNCNEWALPAVFNKIVEEDGILVILDPSLYKNNINFDSLDNSNISNESTDLSPLPSAISLQILRDHNIENVKLMGTPERFKTLHRFGLNILEFISQQPAQPASWH